MFSFYFINYTFKNTLVTQMHILQFIYQLLLVYMIFNPADFTEG